ncbi:hypothetical protein I6F35_13795 [Bradyrhizobium sp. BRP22]|uniref:hypothetical protein n=1 Tax=Bradyrhizobium sp. BRP22 TaxID=2793821 RepID=UPI001CD59029|nr:hypothetical protein [Bradyrhizobium sp. BRP22]MCA1454281.1 hypothetical protein [Bradyrhizobium sp. BRP22]
MMSLSFMIGNGWNFMRSSLAFVNISGLAVAMRECQPSFTYACDTRAQEFRPMMFAATWVFERGPLAAIAAGRSNMLPAGTTGNR